MEQDCCRVCLSKTQSPGRQELYLEDDKSLSVVGQLFEEVLSIPIANGKITLKYICSSCDLQLKLFKQLKNKALESYLLLDDLFNGILCKDEYHVEDEQDIPPPIETNIDLSDIEPLNDDMFKDAYFIENDENTSIAEYIDCQDNEEPQSFITEDIISESDNIIENYLAVIDIDTDAPKTEDDNVFEPIEDEQDDEEKEEVANLVSVDEFNKTEEHIRFYTTDEEEYEASYLEENIVLENLENEISQEEYAEECVIGEENESGCPTLKSKEISEFFPCPHCGDVFKLRSKLKTHIKKMHQMTSKIQCTLCSKALYCEDTYQAHMNIHNGLPAYQCNICEKAFNQKVHYTYHMLNHRNERNIICEICQKAFISKGDLKTHMRSHTDERRYKCDICDKAFRANTHMINHRYSHFEKQFECPECFQKYMSPNTLRTHFKAVHKAEVPFECKFCEKRFKRKHHLQAHYKTHAKVMDTLSISEE